ncbi:MAG: glycoside hydrolase family 16 protein [Bacteroidales bacterium]|nr:glycoside hydrolase family 16 protein [Bacteroidales bacterium]
MKRLYIAAVILAAGCSACQCSSKGPDDNSGLIDETFVPSVGEKDSEGYTLVWADEFDGESLRTADWNVEVNGNGGGNNELQYYAARNVTVENGCLVLTARKESYNGKEFTSGRLNTNKKRYFTHGKIESSIKLPKTANGLWPAFWMLGNDFNEVGWPRCGEIDILEMGNATGIRNNNQETYFNGACHWGFYRDGAYPNYAKSSNAPYSLQDGEFHLYTLIWDERSIAMYLDRDKNPSVQPYFEMLISDTSSDWSTGNYFHHDFFIVYDLAVGGNFPGIHNAAGITALAEGPASMYIDFVRVSQK